MLVRQTLKTIMAVAMLSAGLASSVTACGDDECITVSTTCAPLYEPTFDNVFSQTLAPSCGTPGSSCHAAEGAQGGLVFDNAENSYEHLLGSSGTDARVLAGNPGCSLLVQRLESDDSSTVMPPGLALSAAERCAIIQWVSEGAQR